MSEDRKPQSADKYIVRFPDGMRDRIAEAAKNNGRSMNAEIVHRLEESFTRRHGIGVLAGGAGPTLLTATPDELAELIAEKLASKKPSPPWKE